MKKIPLTQGRFALVDDEDYDFLMQWKWCVSTGYAYRKQRNSDKTRTSILMHHLIIKAPKGMHTDHVDGNGLNNQKSNLRVCTGRQNRMNSKPVTGHSSIFKGVGWHKRQRKWIASIRVHNKLIHLGSFNNEADAAIAYNFAAMEHFGEYARLNRAA